jgi:hypothetical protein
MARLGGNRIRIWGGLLAILAILLAVYFWGPNVFYRYYRNNTTSGEEEKNRIRYREIAFKLSKGESVSKAEIKERDSLDNWFEKRHWENDDGHDPPTKWEEWQAILK